MVGKFFMLAFACVFLNQVQGNDLEDAINDGLYRAEVLDKESQVKIDAAIAEVQDKISQIQSETSEFVAKSVEVQEGIRQDLEKITNNAVNFQLRSLAEELEEKAKENRRPQTALECIKKAEENANTQIEILTDKFKIDMERLESVKLANIDTDSKPLGEMQEALEVRYKRAVKLIQNCQNPNCVVTAFNSFSNWLNLLFAEIKRIQGQVFTIYSNFQRDASNYSYNTNRQIIRIKTTTVENMGQCVRARSLF